MRLDELLFDNSACGEHYIGQYTGAVTADTLHNPMHHQALPADAPLDRIGVLFDDRSKLNGPGDVTRYRLHRSSVEGLLYSSCTPSNPERCWSIANVPACAYGSQFVGNLRGTNGYRHQHLMKGWM